MKIVLLCLIQYSFLLLNMTGIANANELLYNTIDKTFPIAYRGLFLAVFILFFALVSIIVILGFLIYRKSKKLKTQKQGIILLHDLKDAFYKVNFGFVYLKDSNSKYLFVNQEVEKFLNLKSVDIVGKDDFDLTDKEFAEFISKTDISVQQNRTIMVKEVKWRDRIYKLIKFPVKLSDNTYGVGAYIQDETSKYKGIRNLEKTQQRNALLVEILNKNYKSTHEQLDFVINELIKLTESKFGYIYLYDDKTKEFILNSWSKDVMSECTVVEKYTRYQLDETGIWGEVVRQRQPIVVNDFEMLNPLKKGYPEGHVPITRFMSIPVFIDEKIVAVVGLANKFEDYDDNDVDQVTILMNGVWNAKIRRERTIENYRAYQELKESKEQLQLILDSTAEGIFGLDLNGNCTFCNKSCLELLGYEHQSDLQGKFFHRIIHHSRKDGAPLPVEECKIPSTFTTGEGVSSDDEVFWRSDGTCFDVEYNSYPQYRDGEIIGAVVTFTDITSRKKTEKEVLYLSFHDSLTGLFNRRYFEEKFSTLDSKNNLPLSIIMGDVNGLKMTNDIFGHAAGDLLLKKAADVMKKRCRSNDIIARIGGDEYAIILPNTSYEAASEIAEQIQNEFADEKVEALNGSISLGYDTKVDENVDLNTVFNIAEEKMYSQKTLDRKNFNSKTIEIILSALFNNNPKMEEHSKKVSEISQDIGRAMNLSGSEVNRLKDAGLLHDIGSIVIDKEIFNKAELDDEDLHLIRPHPIVGFRILNSSDMTLEIAKYVLSHHERWDGTGYPKGLKGDEIPKLARIIAIAESYVELTYDRGERALSKQDINDEFRRNAGKKYDPAIAEVFVKMLSSKIV